MLISIHLIRGVSVAAISRKLGWKVFTGSLPGYITRCPLKSSIDWVQADHAVTIDPLKSSLYPLHRTATGKLLLSQRPDLCTKLGDRRLLTEIEQARTKGIAWNYRESDPNIIAVAVWAGPPSTTTPVICIKWPVFRFSETKAAKALATIRRVLARL